MQPAPLPPVCLPPLVGPRQYTAYAVIYFDDQGNVVQRGIFSEEHPTVMAFSGRRERTVCIERMVSTKSYGRAACELRRHMGWKTSHWRRPRAS